MRILLADKDRSLRTEVERLLLDRRHAVISASDGSEALAIIRDEVPDMVIANPGLRVPDGSSLLAGVQGICHNIACPPPYFIALMRNPDKGDALNSLMEGADDVLFVPVEPEFLDARLRVAEWTLRPVDEPEGEDADPLAVFTREHEHLLDVMLILDTIARDLEGGVPEVVLTWAATTTFLVSFEMHEEKEERYISAFIDKVVESHGAQLGDLSHSVFSQITDEHALIALAVDALQKGVAEYIAADRAAFAEFESRLEGGASCKGPEADAGEYARFVLTTAGEHATKRAAAVRALQARIREYVDLVRPHLTMEEKAFFPLTQKYLDDGDNRQIAEEFAKIDARLGAETLARHLDEVNRLANAIRENPGAHARRE